MNDNSLSRIPFQASDERIIVSMARWMRFIGIVKVVGSLVTGFVLLVGIIYIGAVLGTEPPPGSAGGPSSITVTTSVGGDTHTQQVPLDKLRRFASENQITLFALGAFGLILAAAGTMLGFVLYHAADDFDRVARSDMADQDYITAGVMQLNTYFKISILLGLAAVLVAMTAGIGLVAKYAPGP